MELVLFKDLISAGFQNLWTYVILAYFPDFIVSLITPIKELFASWIPWILTNLGSLFGSLWTAFIGFIQTTITLTLPGIVEPLAEPIFRGLATTIGVSVLLWILRVIFGFPF